MMNGATFFGSAAPGALCHLAGNGLPAIGLKLRKVTSGLPGIGRMPPHGRRPICPRRQRPWKWAPILQRLPWTTFGRRVVGFGIRGVTPGVRDIGHRAGRIGIGCPAHYVWTPRGYIFVGGFWDYPVARRGVLFAPVYFESGVYSRRGYAYSPTIVINLGVFSDHLFVRPRYCHYYFGDYYAASYSHGGFYASFSFQSSRYGYDPIYSHQRWEHRQDREWEHHVAASYQYRRDHETARPPRTWAAQTKHQSGHGGVHAEPLLVATPIDQLATRKDSPVRFQPVTKNERQQLAQRGQEVQQSRDQRRTLEAKAVDPDGPKTGRGN